MAATGCWRVVALHARESLDNLLGGGLDSITKLASAVEMIAFPVLWQSSTP
jgi:hypothetical protein